MAQIKNSDSSDAVLDRLNLIGQSSLYQQLLESVQQIAPTNITVLITGESGTGKDVIARAIHELSPRRENPLFTVNCGAIPEGILESELFGHEKGSFTGASEQRKGYFELSDKGTLFLDEIGEMPLGTQVKLLRVLEDKTFMRVGGSQPIKVDVRVLAATNKNLESAVRNGEFRKDLFFRLNAIKIEIPPLRKRVEDIRPLAIHFAREVCLENNIKFRGFSDEAFLFLENHNWPGNIRELKNLVERVIILEKGQRIRKDMLEAHVQQQIPADRNLPVIVNKTAEQAERELIYRSLLDIRWLVEDLRNIILGRSSVPGDEIHVDTPQEKNIHSKVNPVNESQPLTLKEIEKIEIEKALEKYKGNRRRVARVLGIGERTLYRKLKEYDLEDH